jgi:hypothetical protein
MGPNASITLLPQGQTSVITSIVASEPATTIDLNDNALVVNYELMSPLETIRHLVETSRGGQGIGNGLWTGLGITSSTAAAANAAEPETWSVGYAENFALPLGPYSNFRGVPVDQSSVLIAYTRTGDANLDGFVNDDDVTIVSATYAPGVPNPNWALGDFDYNGFIDDDDMTLLGAFYQGAGIAAPPALGKDELQRPKNEAAVVRGGGVSEYGVLSPSGAPGAPVVVPVALLAQEHSGFASPPVDASDESMVSTDDDDMLIDLLAESIAAAAQADQSLARDTRHLAYDAASDELVLWSS